MRETHKLSFHEKMQGNRQRPIMWLAPVPGRLLASRTNLKTARKKCGKDSVAGFVKNDHVDHESLCRRIMTKYKSSKLF